jgi:subtilisin-like proprotein convertase family protein
MNRAGRPREAAAGTPIPSRGDITCKETLMTNPSDANDIDSQGVSPQVIIVPEPEAKPVTVEAEAVFDLPATQADLTVSSSIAVAEAGAVGAIKAVFWPTPFIDFSRIELVAPTGDTALLFGAGKLRAVHANIQLTFETTPRGGPVRALVGEPMAGDWTLRLRYASDTNVPAQGKWTLRLVSAA